MNCTAPEVPPLVVTVTFTVPLPAGLVTVICVPESETIDAPVLPKLTPAAFARLVPVIVTLVLPAVLPLPGEIPLTIGLGDPGGMVW